MPAPDMTDIEAILSGIWDLRRADPGKIAAKFGQPAVPEHRRSRSLQTAPPTAIAFRSVGIHADMLQRSAEKFPTLIDLPVQGQYSAKIAVEHKKDGILQFWVKPQFGKGGGLCVVD